MPKQLHWLLSRAEQLRCQVGDRVQSRAINAISPAHAYHAPISFVTVCGRVPQLDRDTLGISVCRIGVELQLDGGTYGPEERLTANERSMEASQSSIFRRNEHNRSRVSLGKVGRRAMP